MTNPTPTTMKRAPRREPQQMQSWRTSQQG
jgi:hypothetical protein